MQFSVGDKVVHPDHGPGLISSVEDRDLLDGPKRYYAIDIPGHRLTVHMPVSRTDQVGLRPATSLASLPGLLSLLGTKPRILPANYKERQEEIWEKLKTGGVTQLAGVVRDLSWHKVRAHLTKRDTDYLRQGRDLLAAEMALVSADDVEEVGRLIEATMTAAVAGRTH